MSKLYIVPTPIGNLKDMTFRAVDVLRNVDIILAEDTRTSGILLKHYAIATPMLSYHMHNEHKVVDGLAKRIKNGETMALISDAGTPAISDPGFLLVSACIEIGIEVDCLPGATAFVPAIVNSGFPNDRFVFEGFLPAKKGRQTKFKSLADESRTIIFYESPHRLVKTLNQIVEYFGSDRSVSVSREISKLHEETIRGSAEEVLEHYTNNPPKGEIVIVIKGKGRENSRPS
jgi:16S rRNA (cytidine1402-2'-O)-methyltransferase